jgi:hypothetical protein
LGAALLAEVFEKAVHHLLAAALSRPHQSPTGVIHDQREVALPSAPADLIDADTVQPIQAVLVARGLLHHAGDDPADRFPVQPHQLAAGLQGALRRKPGHLILEAPQIAAAMASPRDLRDHHPVLAAGDPRCGRFDEEAGVADIQTAPAPTALTLVVEGTAATADRAPLPLVALRAHVRHQAAVRFLDQALQHAMYHTQAAQPYTPTRHVVCLPTRFD